MRWKFIPEGRDYGNWLFSKIGDSSHIVEICPPEKPVFDRGTAMQSRASVARWRKMFTQVWRAWRSSDESVGYITLFPQRAAILGFLNRVFHRRNRVIVWDFNLGSTPRGPRRSAARYALRDIERFVVNSSYEKFKYSEWLALPIDRFYFCHYQKPEIPLHPVRLVDPPVIVAVGSACRDYKTLFEAASILKVRTVIVTAPYQAGLLRHNEYVTVKSNISRDHVHQLIQAATVHVLPLESQDTCTGHVTVVEGMWLRTPLVVSATKSMSDYITPGETALTFQCGDSSSLVDSICKLLNDANLRARLVKNALEFAKQHFTDEVAGQHLRKLMDGKDTGE